MSKPRLYFKDGLWRCSDNVDPIFCGAGVTPDEAFKDYRCWQWRHNGYGGKHTMSQALPTGLLPGEHHHTLNVEGQYLPCPSCGKPGLYFLGNDYRHSQVVPHECSGGHFDSRQPGGKG